MTLGFGYWLAIGLALLAGCQRSESPSSGARPSPVPSIAGPTSAPSPPEAQPSTVATPDADDADDNDDDKPMGPEFEIDADADWFFGYPPMKVNFTAKAMNGTPPFVFTWDFGDGSPQETGQPKEHIYVNYGEYHPFVTGKAANGEESRVSFIVKVVSLEEWARVKGVDPALLRAASASPAPTP
jgi:hypothetical protein